MKNRYVEVKLELIRLNAAEVITTSGDASAGSGSTSGDGNSLDGET